ncbi:hypothetical protein GCM10027071_27410 [Microbacterium marinum]
MHPLREDLELGPDPVRGVPLTPGDRRGFELGPQLRRNDRPGLDDDEHVASRDRPRLPRGQRSREVLDDHARLTDPALHGPVGDPHHPAEFRRHRAEDHVVLPHPTRQPRRLALRETARRSENPKFTYLRRRDLPPGGLDLMHQPGQRREERVRSGSLRRAGHTPILVRASDIPTRVVAT